MGAELRAHDGFRFIIAGNIARCQTARFDDSDLYDAARLLGMAQRPAFTPSGEPAASRSVQAWIEPP